MASQDHVFITIGLVGKAVDSLAVARTDRKGAVLDTFSECVLAGDRFEDLIERMKSVILASRYAKEYVVVAHYADIERAILKKEQAAYASRDGREVFEGRTWLSLSQLVWPMVDAQMLPSASFDSVCAYFGVVRDDGSANSDTEANCQALVRIYFEMMRRYRSSLIAEEGIRDFAGPTIEKFRKLVGF